MRPSQRKLKERRSGIYAHNTNSLLDSLITPQVGVAEHDEICISLRCTPYSGDAPHQCSRSEEKLQALTARLAEERDSAASGLPTILADSMDDESLARMVAQAKVGRRYLHRNIHVRNP